MKSKRNIRAVNKTYLQHSKAGSHTSYRHELVEYLHSMRWDTRSIETSSHEEGDINILGLCIDTKAYALLDFHGVRGPCFLPFYVVVCQGSEMLTNLHRQLWLE